MQSLRKQAITFFTMHTNYCVNDIKSITSIHSGYTNQSFCVRVKNDQYFQIRMANPTNFINRTNEFNVLKKIKDQHYVYYDKHTGNAIKNWIHGTHPSIELINTKYFLNKLSRAINKLHKYRTNVDHIMKNNYLDCLNKAKRHLSRKHRKWYIDLIDKYKDLNLVLSHNDLSVDNMLWTKNKTIEFIDYEWARRNNEYWDFANFIRESELNEESVKYLLKINKQLNKEILKHFIYIAINYAFQWTYNMPKTNKIIEYRKQLKLKLKNFSDQYKYL